MSAALACRRVVEGGPVLQVLHHDEDWQFLCGEDHSDGESCPPREIDIEKALALDPSLAPLFAVLGPHECAEREAPDDPWSRYDGYPDLIEEDVDEFGWHGVVVPDDDQGPGFAYTIGLKPEIILFGLPEAELREILARCAARVLEGEELPIDVPVPGLAKNYPLVFRRVAISAHLDYFGYAAGFHEAVDFPALQAYWPDKAGRYPWEPYFRKDWIELQPPLQSQ